MIQANLGITHWSKVLRVPLKLKKNVNMILRIQELSGHQKVELVIMRCSQEKTSVLIKLLQDLTIIKYFTAKVWNLMFQDLANIHKAKEATSLIQVNPKTEFEQWIRWDQVHSNNLEVTSQKQQHQDTEEAQFSTAKKKDSKKRVWHHIIIRKEPRQMLDQDHMLTWKIQW